MKTAMGAVASPKIAFRYWKHKLPQEQHLANLT
jgi:hypothetical protein